MNIEQMEDFVYNNKPFSSSAARQWLRELLDERKILIGNDGRRKQLAVAIEALSYSEIEAAAAVLETIEGGQALVVASSIADRVGITRSVIVNALRKLEGAGMIETRSLGMKGTHIRIIADELLPAITSRKG